MLAIAAFVNGQQVLTWHTHMRMQVPGILTKKMLLQDAGVSCLRPSHGF